MVATPSFEDRPRYLRELKEFLAIPSVSGASVKRLDYCFSRQMGLVVRERPCRVTKDHAEKHVLLPRSDAQPLRRLRRQGSTRRLRHDLDGLHGSGAIVE